MPRRSPPAGPRPPQEEGPAAAASAEPASPTAATSDGPSSPPGEGSRNAARPVDLRSTLRSAVISDAFRHPGSPERSRRLGLPESASSRSSMMIELNLQFASGLAGAEKRFLDLWKQLLDGRTVERLSDSYYRCDMSLDEAQRLAFEDQGGDEERLGPRDRCIYRIWPDFKLSRLIDRSVATVKADAALRSFGAAGTRITWAVIDSGIDSQHPHFAAYDTLGGDVAELHRDFTQPEIDPDLPAERRDAELKSRIAGALRDDLGHGTHVAGIIAGGIAETAGLKSLLQDKSLAVRVAHGADSERDQFARPERREVDDVKLLSGVAPRAKLVSLKVLSTDTAASTAANVLRALRYVRVEVNGEGKMQRIQGVNLSVGYEFDARWFACGQSPICVEVDRLVRSGVVVVVAAGNTGYGELASKEGITSAGLTLTINDTGNAELAITVGATHRDSPHTYGVSFFSSKGPTGDGRLKPDLVAPGERITSCAAGGHLESMGEVLSDVQATEIPAAYIDDSGTSMAAPHVSGAIAACLSIRREYIGRPEEIKRIFLDTATPLGRERYFEGRGLVDLMRAIQSI